LTSPPSTASDDERAMAGLEKLVQSDDSDSSTIEAQGTAHGVSHRREKMTPKAKTLRRLELSKTERR